LYKKIEKKKQKSKHILHKNSICLKLIKIMFKNKNQFKLGIRSSVTFASIIKNSTIAL